MIIQVRPALQAPRQSGILSHRKRFLAGYETMNVETDKSFPSESATTYIFGSSHSTCGREVVDSSVKSARASACISTCSPAIHTRFLHASLSLTTAIHLLLCRCPFLPEKEISQIPRGKGDICAKMRIYLPFQCRDCNKYFTSEADMQRHHLSRKHGVLASLEDKWKRTMEARCSI